MKFPPPGRMVDVGGRRLHIQISGEATGNRPTVVFEAGLAATSLSWALAQPLLNGVTRTASYDRAGLGWSDERDEPATALNAVNDLHLLLECSGLPAPYILVGHSFGGLIIRIYQQLYPEQVAGLVLVDPVAQVEWRNPTEQRRRLLARGIMLSNRGAFLARLGIVRFALRLLVGGSRRIPALLSKMFAGNAAGFTDRWASEIRKIPREHWPIIADHWSEERAFRVMANYLKNLPLSAAQLDADRGPGELPVVVLSSAGASAEVMAEHEREARLSSRGEHLAVPGTGHWINLDAPAAIASAVRRIIEMRQQHS